MQNVFSRSSLTYEWTQVTPSSAFRSTTARHRAAPSPSAGLGSPSVNVRSTRYRGNSLLLSSATLPAFDGRRGARRAHRPNYLGCPAALPILGGKPEPGRLRGRLAARANAELPEDRRDVVVNRPLGEHEPLGDLGVAEPLRDEPEYLELARSQVGGVLLRRRPQSPRKPACPALPQSARDDGRRRPSTQLLKLVERAPENVVV